MSNNAGSNVIPMRDFDRPAPNPQEAQFDRLLKECHGIAVERLLRSVSTMLDKVEDALWGLADQTHERELRDLYIAAKDKALAQRKYIEEQYRANYVAEFDLRVRRDRKQGDEFSRFELGSLELGLVNDDDLEETLKINEMGAKLRRYCEEELNALDQRIGVLIGDANLQGEANPFSPQAICNAYKQTCRQIESNLKVRMIFHKLFDDHVLDDVRSIFKDLNDLLIQRSILPKIRYGLRRTIGSGIAPRLPAAAALGALGPDAVDAITGAILPGIGVPGVGMAGVGIPGAEMPGVGFAGAGIPGVGLPMAGMADAGYGGDPTSGGEQDLFTVLQGLLAMNARAGIGGGSATGMGTGPAGMPGSAGAGGMIQIPGFPPILGMPAGSGGLPGGVVGGVPGAGGTGGIAGGIPGGSGGGFVGGIPGGGSGGGFVGGIPGGGGGGGFAGGVPGGGGGGGFVGGVPGGGGGVGGGLMVPHVLLQGAELIGALTRLQHGDLGGIPGAPSTLDAAAFASGTTNVVRELKSTTIGDSVDQTDGMTIDIVAMLFDQIFGDHRVPQALKGLIGRLQIPVVKVAVLDKRFFSKKSHPARRMLDTLGEFALGLDDTFDYNSPVYKKLEAIIQQLISGFEDDIGIFDTLQEDLLALVREENQRAEETAKEAARKIAYMERLEVGKALSQLEIKRRAETTRMPQLVLRFLAEEWVKLLLLAHARYGKDSEAWKSALETMDLLIWSVNHKPSVEERRKLATMLPPLLKRLHAGLQAAGTRSETRDRFFAKLMRMHTKVISGVAPAARVTNSDASANTAARPTVVPTLTDAVAPQPTVGDSAAGPTDAERSPAASEHKVSAQPITAMPARVPEIDEDSEPATAAPQFSDVTIKNPFGEGDIQVEEISLSDLPGSGAGDSSSSQSRPTDQHSQSVTNLKAGAWIEFRDDEDNRTQAKLSYISPLKGTYLFVNRQGAKVGEYSIYELAREFRTGRAVVLESVPLFDRAMSSLVGALKKNAK